MSTALCILPEMHQEYSRLSEFAYAMPVLYTLFPIYIYIWLSLLLCGGSGAKESTSNVGDQGSVPGSG